MTSAVETAEVMSALHQSCDGLIQNVVAFKTARAGEVDALKNARAVFAGADCSLCSLALLTLEILSGVCMSATSFIWDLSLSKEPSASL